MYEYPARRHPLFRPPGRAPPFVSPHQPTVPVLIHPTALACVHRFRRLASLLCSRACAASRLGGGGASPTPSTDPPSIVSPPAPAPPVAVISFAEIFPRASKNTIRSRTCSSRSRIFSASTRSRAFAASSASVSRVLSSPWFASSVSLSDCRTPHSFLNAEIVPRCASIFWFSSLVFSRASRASFTAPAMILACAVAFAAASWRPSFSAFSAAMMSSKYRRWPSNCDVRSWLYSE
eukprot:17530-Pelagococcus_subviridis.AAC.2